MQPKLSSWKFVEDRRTPVYKTLAAELDAIVQGKKALSFFATDREGLAEDLASIQPSARSRGLTVAVVPRGRAKSDQPIDLFVHRTDLAPARRVARERRIVALQTLLSQSPWTFDHEASLGELLGYSRAQRTAWLLAEHHARPGFGVLTLYGESRVNHAPPGSWWTEPGRVVAPDAYKKRDRMLELWRVGVQPTYAKKLDSKGRILLWKDSHQRAFDKAMRTPYETLGPKGWVIATL